jgi:hypothetical protein
MELSLRDAGFYRYIGQVLVEINNLIHAPEIEQDAGVGHGNARSVASIFPGADRIDSDSKLVCDAQAFLNLAAGSWTENRSDGLRSGERGSFCSRQSGSIYQCKICTDNLDPTL